MSRSLRHRLAGKVHCSPDLLSPIEVSSSLASPLSARILLPEPYSHQLRAIHIAIWPEQSLRPPERNLRGSLCQKMDNNRGRSPARGNAQHISPQPSPNLFSGPVPGVDPSVQQALTQGKFNTAANAFSNPFLPSQQQGGLQPDPNQSNYYNNQQYHQNLYQDNQFGGQDLNQSYNNGGNFMYQNENVNSDFNQNYSLNQAFDMKTQYDINAQNNVNPAELSKVSSPQDNQSPGLQLPEQQKQPSQPGSPASTNGQFFTPQHSRNVSLDPSSAYSGVSFTQHRRAPSEHSDVSSAQHSPYLAHAEMNNPGVALGHSPYLPAQQDANNAFGMESFSLGDQQPYRSPRLMPHMEGNQPGPGMDGSGLHLSQPMGIPVPDVYTTQPPQYQIQPPVVPSNHLRNTSVVSDLGQADQYAPPTINIEPAPVSRQQSFGPAGEEMEGALSPPSSSSKSLHRLSYLAYANNRYRRSEQKQIRRHIHTSTIKIKLSWTHGL